MYWLRRGGLLGSTINPAVFAKALGKVNTARNANTIQRLTAKYPPD